MNLRGLILATFLGVAIVAGMGMAFLQHIIPSCAQTINATDISSNGGNSYYAASKLQSRWPLLFQVQTDASGRSNAIVTEDGKALVAPHALHKAILEQGNGRYSLWGSSKTSVIIFSTSDNSDPRTNGRRYEIVARPGPSMFGASLMLALPIAILILQKLLFPTSRLIYGVAAIALAVYVSFFFGRVALGDDTVTYVTWSPLVPLGYPLFLSAVRNLFGGLRWAGTIQMALLVAACAFVALSAERLTGRRIVGVVVLLILICYTQIFVQQGWLFSEALFIPLVIFNLGAAFFLISEKSAAAALLLAMTSALIIFVRPAGYFVPLGMVFLLLAQRERIRWTLAWVCIPFAVLMVATALINIGVRGNASQSQTGSVLFPYVAFLFEPQFASDGNKEFAKLVEQTMEARLVKYKSSPDRAARILYSMNDYNSRLHAMGDAFDEHCSSTTGNPCSYQSKETIFREFFFSTIRHRPIEYVQLIADGLIEAWRTTIMDAWAGFSNAYSLEDASRDRRLEKIRGSSLPLMGEDIALYPELLREFPGTFVDALDSVRVYIRAQRGLICLIGIVTLFAIPMSIFARSRHWLALGYCGVIIHGSMLLTAAVTVFIPRYALPIDPVIILAGIIALDGILSWLLNIVRLEAVSPQPLSDSP